MPYPTFSAWCSSLQILDSHEHRLQQRAHTGSRLLHDFLRLVYSADNLVGAVVWLEGSRLHATNRKSNLHGFTGCGISGKYDHLAKLHSEQNSIKINSKSLLKIVMSNYLFGFQIFATCCTFYVPLLAILALYWNIYKIARRRIQRRIQQRPLSAAPNQKQVSVAVQQTLPTALPSLAHNFLRGLSLYCCMSPPAIGSVVVSRQSLQSSQWYCKNIINLLPPTLHHPPSVISPRWPPTFCFQKGTRNAAAIN